MSRWPFANHDLCGLNWSRNWLLPNQSSLWSSMDVSWTSSPRKPWSVGVWLLWQRIMAWDSGQLGQDCCLWSSQVGNNFELLSHEITWYFWPWFQIWTDIIFTQITFELLFLQAWWYSGWCNCCGNKMRWSHHSSWSCQHWLWFQGIFYYL